MDNTTFSLYQPLRFRKRIGSYTPSRGGCSGGVFKLIMPLDYLLPFQIIREASAFPVTSIKYISEATGTEYEVLGDLAPGQVDLFQFSDSDRIVHYGTEAHGLALSAGDYRIVVTAGPDSWDSVVFRLKDFDPDDLGANSCEITKISYRSGCDVDGILYGTAQLGGLSTPDYTSILFLEVQPGKPAYDFTEEGEEDGLGNFTPSFRRLTKKHNLQVVVPEFMVDALQILPLHDNIEVSTPDGYTRQVGTIAVASDWQDTKGCWALVDILYSNSATVKTGCCTGETTVIGCLRASGEFVARILEDSADYLAFQYTSAADGVTPVPLTDGDMVLVEGLDGILLLKEYNETGGTYDAPAVILSLGDTYVDLNERDGITPTPILYYYWGGSGVIGFLDTPEITDVTFDALNSAWLVTGKSFTDSAVQVYGKVDGDYILAAQGSGADFNTSGILFDMPEGATFVKIISVGATGCEAAESSDFELTVGFIGAGIIGSTFLLY